MTDVYQKVREGHRFDLLERGYHSETPRMFKKKNVCKPMLSVHWKSKTKA
jgi:hypothetical protein